MWVVRHKQIEIIVSSRGFLYHLLPAYIVDVIHEFSVDTRAVDRLFRVLVGQCHPGRLKSPPAMIMALFILEARWADSIKAFMLFASSVWGW